MAAHNVDVTRDFGIEFRISNHVCNIIIDDNNIFDGVNIGDLCSSIAASKQKLTCH